MQISAGKFLASIFGDVQGILFINYLEKGKTINSKLYSINGAFEGRNHQKTATNEEEKSGNLLSLLLRCSTRPHELGT